MVRGANASLALVFPSYRARDQKQVMAWDWPTIELSGDALAYYEGGALGQHQRDTVRLLEGALFGTHDGKDNFSKLAGTPSRFHSLTGELRTAAELLGTIIREGVLTRATEEANWVQREGLETLFEKIPSTRGKAGATTDGVEFAKGDAFDVLLFDPPEAEVRVHPFSSRCRTLPARAPLPAIACPHTAPLVVCVGSGRVCGGGRGSGGGGHDPGRAQRSGQLPVQPQ
jgi:hypothetical protein